MADTTRSDLAPAITTATDDVRIYVTPTILDGGQRVSIALGTMNARMHAELTRAETLHLMEHLRHAYLDEQPAGDGEVAG